MRHSVVICLHGGCSKQVAVRPSPYDLDASQEAFSQPPDLWARIMPLPSRTWGRVSLPHHVSHHSHCWGRLKMGTVCCGAGGGGGRRQRGTEAGCQHGGRQKPAQGVRGKSEQNSSCTSKHLSGSGGASCSTVRQS